MSLLGREFLLLGGCKGWVYDIQASTWMHVPRFDIRSMYLEGSCNGLLYGSTPEGVYVWNPLEGPHSFHCLVTSHCKELFCIALFDVEHGTEDTTRTNFKVYIQGQPKRSSLLKGACRIFDSGTYEWKDVTPNMADGGPYRQVTNRKVVSRTRKFYFIRECFERPGFLVASTIPEGVICFNISDSSWEVVTVKLPQGLVVDHSQKPRLHWRAEDQPVILEVDGQLFLIGHCVQPEVKQFLGVWQMDLSKDRESREWRELTRLPDDMLNRLVDTSRDDHQLHLVPAVDHSKVFIAGSLSKNRLAVFNLKPSEWSWLPESPVEFTVDRYFSGCVYTPSSAAKLNFSQKRSMIEDAKARKVARVRTTETEKNNKRFRSNTGG